MILQLPACIAASSVLALLLCSDAQAQTTNAVLGLETIEETHVLLDAVPIRPMAISETSTNIRIWAANVQANWVAEYSLAAPPRVFDVPWNPISVAHYTSTDTTYPGEKLLVVCRGSYALACVDLVTGEVERLLQIPPQPADIIVDEAAQQAYVSCQARDEVIQVDLTGDMSVTATFKVPSKTPTSLFFNGTGNPMVVPLHSGNNSGVHKVASGVNLQAGSRRIIDFDSAITLPVAGVKGLPDEDLFQFGVQSGVARGIGTILYSAAYNAVTNTYWVLNSEALNKDPNQTSVSDLAGLFSFNRLTIVDASNPTSKSFVYLDDSDPVAPGIQYNSATSIAHPDGLTITSQGTAFLVGTGSNNVAALDTQGQVTAEWDLPSGSIPRQVLWSPTLSSCFVYCWGTNEVLAYYTMTTTPVLWGTFTLGIDPTSDSRKDGRKIFYDASNSLHGNLSCETCHVYGEADFLAWNLSHGVDDAKGPMMTQTLRGIDGTMPFHWRGEQQVGIADFNPAFADLLGGSQLGATDLASLSDYLLALRGDANPFQNADRLADSSIQPPLTTAGTADAAFAGQTVFAINCFNCHATPTGSNNEVQRLQAGHLNPRRQRFEVGTFNGLWKKHQDANPMTAVVDTVSVLFDNTNPLYADMPASQEYPLMGYGFGHAGTVNSLHEFQDFFMLNGQEKIDAAGFVYQFDQRMAPMAHRAILLNTVSAAGSAVGEISHLMDLADAGQGDIAVFGLSTIGTIRRPVRWLYRPSSRDFVPEADLVLQTAFQSEGLTFFEQQARNGEGSNVFMGLPRGTGRAVALDYDMDGRVNLLEEEPPSPLPVTNPYERDTDGDGDWDDHEALNGGDPLNAAVQSNDVTDPVIRSVRVLSVTSRNAVLCIETDEPTSVVVDYQVPAGPTKQASSVTPGTVHRVVLDALEASTGGPLFYTVGNAYSIVVTVTDLGGRLSTATALTEPLQVPYDLMHVLAGAPPGTVFAASAFQIPDPHFVTVEGLSLVSSNLLGGTLSVSVTYDVEFLNGASGTPAGKYMAVCTVLKNGSPVAMTLPGGGIPKSLEYLDPNTGVEVAYPLPSVDPSAVAGPFFVPPTDTDTLGHGTLAFDVPGIVSTDSVVLNIEFVGKLEAVTSTSVVLEGIHQWDMPTTPAGFRSIVLQ